MADKTKERKTEEYVLKPGHEHNGFKDGERHVYVGGQKGNDRVQLTENQAKAFADKFENAKEHSERMATQSELETLKAQLAKKGIDISELMSDGDVTIKKPDPQPGVGTAEPAPKNVIPAPVGSTGDPVNQTTTSPAQATAGTAAAAAKK